MVYTKRAWFTHNYFVLWKHNKQCFRFSACVRYFRWYARETRESCLAVYYLCSPLNPKTNFFLCSWLFYIEGSLTIAVAMAAIFILPDFPLTTRWLSPLERKLALQRMAEDGGINVGDQDETEPINAEAKDNLDVVYSSRIKRKWTSSRHSSGLWLAVTDWRVWWLALALTSEVTALSFNAFFPTLTATLGFNTTISLILVAPPFIVTAICAFFISR